MAGTTIGSPFRLTIQEPLDERVKSVNTKEDLKSIEREVRFYGMTVLVENEKREYWLPDGTADSNWVPKITGTDCGEF